MKKDVYIDIGLIIIIIILGIYIGLNLFKDNKVTFISDSDYLYDKAIDYLRDNDTNPDKKYSNYKMFLDYKGFGIAKDKKYKYAYMWIIVDSYYVKNKRLVNSTSHSIPYKFIFKKNDKVVKYVMPSDGRDYEFTIKGIFPKKIQKYILKYDVNSDKIDREVKDYYKDIITE